MVFSRINFIRIFIICIFTILFAALLTAKDNFTETNFAKAILPGEIVNNTKIIPLIERSSSAIRVVFESDSEAGELKEKFMQDIDRNRFTDISADFSGLIDRYSEAPANFLSVNTRKLLKSGDYETVYKQGLERLYNPAGFPVVSLDKDPFLLLTDFLYSLDTVKQNKSFNGKYYDTAVLEHKNGDIKDLIKLRNKYSDENNRIYLAGTPVHTYYTTLSNIISINIICVLITVLIIFLTYFYFKNFRILLPVALSIAFGFLAGYSVTKFLFSNFHLVTLLFGTTLVGIGVDYSYHYIFRDSFDKSFIKNLTLSLISTVAAFSLLFLTKTGILNQIAVFTIAGLIAVYLFIIILYPAINFSSPQKIFNPEISRKLRTGLIISVSAVIIFGLPKVKFNDDLTALYTPDETLKKSETLFNRISNQGDGKNYIIAVKGNSLQDLLEKEEIATSQFDSKNINYICVSKFIPSEKRQKENAGLAGNLYNSQLNRYGDILSKQQTEDLKQKKYTPVSLNINDYPFFKNLFPDENTSLIISFSDKTPEVNPKNAEIISIRSTLSDCLKNHRHNLQKLLPAIYVMLLLILTAAYGVKKSLKMFMPILLSQVFAVAFISLLGVKLNMFSVLGLILSLGFTIDYAIFSGNKSKRTSAAIFLACITTALSFLLLIFTTFSLISMLALTTSVCIISGYIFTGIFIRDKQDMV